MPQDLGSVNEAYNCPPWALLPDLIAFIYWSSAKFLAYMPTYQSPLLGVYLNKKSNDLFSGISNLDILKGSPLRSPVYLYDNLADVTPLSPGKSCVNEKLYEVSATLGKSLPCKLTGFASLSGQKMFAAGLKPRGVKQLKPPDLYQTCPIF